MNDLIERLREFKRRRYEGVSTTELDPLWGDTLRNWRECPSDLRQEIKFRFLTSSFTLCKKDESWLVFSRFYYQFELPRLGKRSTTIFIPKNASTLRKKLPTLHRLPDHIAINRQTGEIRRFVDVAENEVLDDLRGIHSAPAQAELSAFWGKRKPSGIREQTRERFRRQFRDEQGVHIPKLIHLLHFPFYGPVGNPLDLTLRCSLSLSIVSLDFLTSVGFVYSRSSQPGVFIELEVSEDNTKAHIYIDKGTSGQTPSSFNLAHKFFQGKNKSEGEEETVENLHSWQGNLTIAGNLFIGELYHQAQPDQLSWFSLASEQTKLTGNACGLSEDELFQWLATLQIINQQDDVLLSYQHEYDEDRQRVESENE